MIAKLAPWWPLIKLGLALAVVTVAWLHGCTTGKQQAQERHEAELAAAHVARIQFYEDQIEAARVEAQVSRAASNAYARKLDTLAATYQDLRTAIAKAPLIIRETTDETCPDPRLSPVVRLCRNAAATGDPDAAARCATVGVSQPEPARPAPGP